MGTPKTIERSIARLTIKWQLSNTRTIANVPLFNNYIAIAFSDIYQKDVVLKILIADTNEPEALMAFNGNGSVKLLDYDAELKGLLLEYIKPGYTLKTLFPHNDSEAIKITAELIKKMHSKKLIFQVGKFKTINQWLELLDNFKSNKIPEYSLNKARDLAKQLLSIKQEQYLLHGDLHHDNILKDNLEWIAIDPKGVIGPLEYEVGRFIMNPIPDLLKQDNAKEIIKNRFEQFSKLFGFEKQRLIDWAFVQSILNACWTEEDGGDLFFNYFIAFAKVIESL